MTATTWYVRAIALTVVATAATGFVAAFGIGFASAVEDSDVGLWIAAAAGLVQFFALFTAGTHYFKGVNLQYREKQMADNEHRTAGMNAEQVATVEEDDKVMQSEILVVVGIVLVLLAVAGAFFLFAQ